MHGPSDTNQESSRKKRSRKGAETDHWDVVIVGGGVAGLAASIYLSRAMHRTLVIDSGHSMVVWEPAVENYFGFPDGIAGMDLLRRGHRQARRFGVSFAEDEVKELAAAHGDFAIRGSKASWRARRVLLATGIYHLPPDLDGVRECLGYSMFFCKDCDGHRVWGKRIAVYGHSNESAEYALAMLAYSPAVSLVTDGREVQWDEQHQRWIKQFSIPVFPDAIVAITRTGRQLRTLNFKNGKALECDALFTTRGDVFFNHLARQVGAKLDPSGQVKVDSEGRTSVKGVFAAGCVTPANCQIGVAAGQGVVAAQAINRDLFEEELALGQLRQFQPGARFAPRQHPAPRKRASIVPTGKRVRRTPRR